MLGCGQRKAAAHDEDFGGGEAFISETTITAHSRIPLNRIPRAVLSQSALILWRREGGDDKEQRVPGCRGGRMTKKRGGKTKRAAPVSFPLPKKPLAGRERRKKPFCVGDC